MLKRLSVITVIWLMLIGCGTNATNSIDQANSKPKQTQEKPQLKKGSGVIAPINAATGEFELLYVTGLEGENDANGKLIDKDFIEVRKGDKSKVFLVNIYEVIKKENPYGSKPTVKTDDIVLIPVDNPDDWRGGPYSSYVAAKVVSVEGDNIIKGYEIKVKPLQSDLIGYKYRIDSAKLEPLDGGNGEYFKAKEWYILTPTSIEKIQTAK
jgi:hypothetical protein